MTLLNRFILIINYKTFVVAFLSLVSTYVCHTYELVANFPLTLVSIAIVFPIVFSINSAYKRREAALQQYAIVKGHLVAIYYASRDWIKLDDNPFPARFRLLFEEAMSNIRILFLDPKNQGGELDRAVYRSFNKISKTIQELRENGLNSSEISRTNQYLSKTMIAFEAMRNIAFYRTPITLRFYSQLFIYSFPVLYGPYFAYTFNEYETHLAYLMPVLYSFILVSLANIQDQLELPYDEIGEDDIKLEIKEIHNILHDEV